MTRKRLPDGSLAIERLRPHEVELLLGAFGDAGLDAARAGLVVSDLVALIVARDGRCSPARAHRLIAHAQAVDFLVRRDGLYMPAPDVLPRVRPAKVMGAPELTWRPPCASSPLGLCASLGGGFRPDDDLPPAYGSRLADLPHRAARRAFVEDD